MNWDPRCDAIPTFVNDEGHEGTANVTNDDELVDVARNSCASIKSIYFPPNLSEPLASSCDLGKSKRQQRVSTDVETLLKIDQELGPLRYQYSEIIGKARALGLSSTDFDLDISCSLNRLDTFVRSALLPSASDYLPNRRRTYLRRATINTGIANRSALVDKTSPSSTFSMVGKPTPRGSRTNWLNENGSSRRQEALSSTVRDPSRVLENFDGPRSSGRVRSSVSYFPTTNSHMFRGENVLNDRSRDGCVSNSNFQLYHRSNAVMERATSAWDDWFARGTVNTNPANIFNRTEYNSHRYLNRTMEDSRTSIDNSFEIRRRKSSVSIVEVINNDWSTVDKRIANKRSNEHSEIPSGNQNAMAVETEFASSGSHYRESMLPETERLAKDDQISSSLVLKSIDPEVDPDREILRAVSTSACAPQIRVVSLNTEFRTTVEKRYTNRAISPIQQPRLTTTSSTTTSLSNILLAAKVSRIFVQQVRADSSRKMTKIESSAKICSTDVIKQDALANVASKRDFCVQKVDSRLAAENLSRLSEFKRDEADLTTTEFRKTRYLHLPRTNDKITIVPIVLTDGISESPRTADVDFAIPRYAVKTAPKLSYQIASFDARKFHGTSSLLSRDNAGYRRDIAKPVRLTEKFAGEKRWSAGRTSVSHVNRHVYAEKDYLPSTTMTTTTSIAGNPKQPIRITTSNAGVVRKAREYRESDRQRVGKTIPGMRSTPEDFLCET
ncbi:uncharacterized protein LOC143899594 [Temnothorax americanus]|uniref:uncharacterized protein LOC143899594 n=1 Tax=Temnothorax americanus TaxID=1964332 RepID=UPI0040691372